jgi:transposase-like protein
VTGEVTSGSRLYNPIMSSPLKMRCQRCGAQMEMRDPAPGGEWKPDQFWVCPLCGRHFWTTYTAPPKPAQPSPKMDRAPGSDGTIGGTASN